MIAVVDALQSVGVKRFGYVDRAGGHARARWGLAAASRRATQDMGVAMPVLTPDEIDFSLYERETDAQKVRPARVGAGADRPHRRRRECERRITPWRKTHQSCNPTGRGDGVGGERKRQVAGDRAGGLSRFARRARRYAWPVRDEAAKTLERDVPAVVRVRSRTISVSRRMSGHSLAEVYGQFRDWTDRPWLYDQQGTVTVVAGLRRGPVLRQGTPVTHGGG